MSKVFPSHRYTKSVSKGNANVHVPDAKAVQQEKAKFLRARAHGQILPDLATDIISRHQNKLKIGFTKHPPAEKTKVADFEAGKPVSIENLPKRSKTINSSPVNKILRLPHYRSVNKMNNGRHTQRPLQPYIADEKPASWKPVDVPATASDLVDILSKLSSSGQTTMSMSAHGEHFKFNLKSKRKDRPIRVVLAGLGEDIQKTIDQQLEVHRIILLLLKSYGF